MFQIKSKMLMVVLLVVTNLLILFSCSGSSGVSGSQIGKDVMNNWGNWAGEKIISTERYGNVYKRSMGGENLEVRYPLKVKIQKNNSIKIFEVTVHYECSVDMKNCHYMNYSVGESYPAE